MSTAPDNEFDLEKLFLPAWAQESSAEKYSKYEGEAISDRRDDRRGFRPGRRDRPREARRDDRGPRPQGQDRPPRGDRRGGPSRGPRGRQEDERPPFRRGERREAPAPLPEVEISLLPDEKGVESLARQIKMTGRAYPLFDIAQMILQKPERHAVSFAVKKNAEGQPVQPLFVCALDDTLWLSEDEAIGHVLKKHFTTFYQAERTATEPPKGKYTFVAQCGISGVILGPPNYHDYQNQLRKLHNERFARMPFETYKSRVKIVRDEAVVKKWIDDQSWKTEYLCLNMPEPLRLGSMEAVEKHFRETHKENIIKPVESHTLSGTTSRNLRSPELLRLVRSVWEDQRRFPLQIATVLSQQFAGHGLQFFKVNRTITHVSVARPHYLDLEATPVSDGVKRIVDYINSKPKCTRRQLIETLAPSPRVLVLSPPTEIPVGEQVASTPQPPQQQTAESQEPTAEQKDLIADLHWLIHQGHVIEFANGTLETAKKPLPKPPKPQPKTAADAAVAGAAAENAASPVEPGVTAESVATDSPEQAGNTQSAAETGTEAPVESASAPAETSVSEPPPTVGPHTHEDPQTATPSQDADNHASETPTNREVPIDHPSPVESPS